MEANELRAAEKLEQVGGADPAREPVNHGRRQPAERNFLPPFGYRIPSPRGLARGGESLQWLEKHDKDAASAVVRKTPVVGRWDDLQALEESDMKQLVFSMMKEALEKLHKIIKTSIVILYKVI